MVYISKMLLQTCCSHNSLWFHATHGIRPVTSNNASVGGFTVCFYGSRGTEKSMFELFNFYLKIIVSHICVQL